MLSDWASVDAVELGVRAISLSVVLSHCLAISSMTEPDPELLSDAVAVAETLGTEGVAAAESAFARAIQSMLVVVETVVDSDEVLAGASQSKLAGVLVVVTALSESQLADATVVDSLAVADTALSAAFAQLLLSEEAPAEVASALAVDTVLSALLLETAGCASVEAAVEAS